MESNYNGIKRYKIKRLSSKYFRRIKRFNTQLDLINDRVDRMKNLTLEEQRFFTSESSLLYMLDGYDGIYIDNIGYYVIYNRGGFIIREE